MSNERQGAHAARPGRTITEKVLIFQGMHIAPQILSKEEQDALVTRYKATRNPQLLLEIIGCCIRIINRLAKRYASSYRISFEQLVQESIVGVIEAVESFDSQFTARFTTYARWWIVKAIFEAIADANVVLTPAYQRKAQKTIADARHELERIHGRAAQREEIASHLNTSLAKVDAKLRRIVRTTSIDTPPDADAQEMRRLFELPDTNYLSPDALLVADELDTLLTRALKQLPVRELQVITFRYGLNGEPRKTQVELGRTLGVSKNRISQIEEQALLRLRQLMKSSPAKNRNA